MKNLEPALEIIKKYEGCILHTYKDVKGINTIGWGHTGPEASPGRHVTQAEADALLAKDLEHFVTGVAHLVKVPCSNNEFCALVSFSYNVGLGALAGSTLLRDLNHNLPREQAANEFLHWIYAGHKIYDGLLRRRKEERELFLMPPFEPVAVA